MAREPLDAKAFLVPPEQRAEVRADVHFDELTAVNCVGTASVSCFPATCFRFLSCWGWGKGYILRHTEVRNEYEPCAQGGLEG